MSSGISRAIVLRRRHGRMHGRLRNLVHELRKQVAVLSEDHSSCDMCVPLGLVQEHVGFVAGMRTLGFFGRIVFAMYFIFHPKSLLPETHGENGGAR